MLTPRDTFKADISESESKIVNYESVLETEKEKLIMYKDILQNNETFNNLLQECSATIQNDLQTYIDTNERAIYSRMAELRDEYSELFAELQNTRGDIENQISDFNNLCDNYRRHDLKKGTNFHQNVKLVNPAFPELGIIYPPISVPIYSSDIKFRFECAKNGIERTDSEPDESILDIVRETRDKTVQEKLNELEDKGLIVYDVEELPTKTPRKHRFEENEIIPVILCYVLADFRISSNEIARRTGLHPMTVRKYRNSEKFKELYSREMGKELAVIRGEAINSLSRILHDKKSSKKELIEASKVLLNHSADVSNFMLEKEKQKINVEEILKEIENFDV